jgi:hypothetical protein
MKSTNQHDRNDPHKVMKLAEEEWIKRTHSWQNTAKTVNERLAENVSRALSGGAIHCLVGPDIVW